MNRKAVGLFTIILSPVLLIVYLWLLLFTPADWIIYGMPIRWWALAIPTLIFMVGALVVMAWVGYLLFSIPKSQPIEEMIEEKRNKTGSNSR